MSEYEVGSQIQFKSSDGSYYDLYPKTKVECVENAVRTVGGVAPDENGNVNIELSTDAISGLGYYRVVNTIEERNALVPKHGLLVYVKDEDTTYQCKGDTVADWEEFVSGASVPVLSYTPDNPEGIKIVCNKGDYVNVKVFFKASTRGTWTAEILKDGVSVRAESKSQGNVFVSLGRQTTEGTYVYTIKGTDFQGFASPDELTFTVVCGGLTLSSAFNDTDDDVVYQDTDTIDVDYTYSCGDTSSIVKMDWVLYNSDGSICRQGTVPDVFVPIVDKNAIGTKFLSFRGLAPGTYSLTMQAYTGVNPSDTSNNAFASKVVTVTLVVLEQYGKSIFSTFNGSGLTKNSNINIGFRILAIDTSKLYYYSCELYDAHDNLLKSLDVSESISLRVGEHGGWYVGLLTPGRYKYVLYAYNNERKDKSAPYTGYFEVSDIVNELVDYTSAGCLAYFLSKSKANSQHDKNIWRSEIESIDQYTYGIQLHNLNYSNNGWVTDTGDDNDENRFLKFDGESWGQLVDLSKPPDENGNYPPINLRENDTSRSTGYAIEVLFRTRCVGELDFRALTTQHGLNKASSGVSITYENLIFSSANGTEAELSFSEERWTHVVFVADRQMRYLEGSKEALAHPEDIIVSRNNVEDINPFNTLRIYINGVLCSCVKLSDTEYFKADNPMFLNAAYNAVTGTVDYFGECEFKLIRIYGQPLTSTQVLNNYISSRDTEEEQEALVAKNSLTDSTMPVVIFSRNRIANGTETFTDADGTKKQIVHTNFETLNTITDKTLSKGNYVDCTVTLNYPDRESQTWENVAVYLQGTSTLQFPVKNYKLKIFKDDTHKKKRYVQVDRWKPIGSTLPDERWEPETTFTLKCDYMECAHLNNTPLADFFNKLVDQVSDGTSKMSPAKFCNTVDGERNYRDAISGFPCLVYYTDDPSDASKMTLAGTYMFNLDKTAKSLGFECDLYPQDKDGNYYVPENDADMRENQCQSYESSTNTSHSAGCFYQLTDPGILDYSYEQYANDFWKSAADRYNKKNNVHYSVERYKATEEGIRYANGEEIDGYKLMTFAEYSLTFDKYDFVANDFELRYDAFEDLDSKEKSFDAMVKMIEGVSESLANNTFREYVLKHFDLNYVLVYYLQMIVFCMADNAGKNSMWDTWDGEHWYIRTYDMDTSMGLTNTGEEKIPVDAELNADISPAGISVRDSDDYVANFSVCDADSVRYSYYTTANSRFWLNFAKEFKNEISGMYATLRSNGTYTMPSIIEHFTSRTTDIIGERFYNKDMAVKFLMNSTYLNRLHGNRLEKFKKWMTERIIFCDTMYNYKSGDSLNTNINLRSDVMVGKPTDAQPETVYIAVETYTPQYVTLNVGTNKDTVMTAYVGPESTYTDPGSEYVDEDGNVVPGETRHGVLFTFRVIAKDKEMHITGAGGIKRIGYLQVLKPRTLEIENATKIIDIDVSSATLLTSLKLGSNKYLRTLNCSNATNLGKDGDNGTNLDLTNCIELRNLDVSNTKLLSITFGDGAPLKSANFAGCRIGELNFKYMNNLDTIDVSSCNYLSKFFMDSCNSMVDISLARTSVTDVEVYRCKSLKRLDVSECNNLRKFVCDGCESIELLNAQDIRIPSTLDVDLELPLNTMYSLRELNVSGSTYDTIILPYYMEADMYDGDEGVQRWNKLRKLYINGADTKYIQYGLEKVPEAEKCFDMTYLSNLEEFAVHDNASIVNIKNMVYETSNLEGMFKNCTKLEHISGTLYGNMNCTSAEEMFYHCYELQDLSELNIGMPNVKSINRIAECWYHDNTSYGKLSWNGIRKIVNACGDSLETMDRAFTGHNINLVSVFPPDVFTTVRNVKSAKYAFATTGIEEINNNALKDLVNLQDATYMFANCKKLTTVYTEVLAGCPELISVAGMFAECTALTLSRAINSVIAHLFTNNAKIKTTHGMFYNCTNLKVAAEKDGGETISGLLNPLVNLVSCAMMFYNCKSLKTPIPDGLLGYSQHLEYAYCMFYNCENITTLCTRLLRPRSYYETEIPLKYAGAMFYGCKNLTGAVNKDFFAGGTSLYNIGSFSVTYEYEGMNDTNYLRGHWNSTTTTFGVLNDGTLNTGFFNGTGIYGYHESVLEPAGEALTNVCGFFANCASLVACSYVSGINVNGISPNIFKNNPKLQIASYFFKGCTSLVGGLCYNDIDGVHQSMFYPCRNAIIDLAGFLKDCNGLDGTNKLTNKQDTLSTALFEGCVNLKFVNDFFSGCTNLVMYLPESTIFVRCESLADTSNMFRDCIGLQSIDTERCIPLNLFSDCRGTIQNTAYMFYNCQNLVGIIPTADANDYDEVGLFNDCLRLMNVAGMFAMCINVTGAVPYDMFSVSSTISKFNYLRNISYLFYETDINEVYESSDSMYYICSPDWLINTAYITDASYVFCNIGDINQCRVPGGLFKSQLRLQNVAGLFKGISNLTGTVPADFLGTNYSTVTDIRRLFEETSITGISNYFLRANSTSINNKLVYAAACFANCDKLRGEAPKLWASDVYTKIDNSKEGKNAAFYNTKFDNLETAGPEWTGSDYTNVVVK